MSLMRLLLASALALVAHGANAQVALTGTPVQQNFDTLVNTGTGTQAQVPSGWAFLESTANTSYTATDGSANSGDTYSAGAVGSTDRAFATLASGTTQSRIGAQFVNQTGAPITDLTIAYTGEQWRNGTTTAADNLNFAISTDATGLGTGTWTEVDQLDFAGPVAGATAAPIDGNVPANQTAISFTITGLSIAANQGFWIRWVDTDSSGSDDMLGIDTFSLSTTGPGDLPPAVSSTTPTNLAVNQSTTGNITVQFSEPVTTSAGWFTLSCNPGGSIAVTESGTGATRTLDPVADLPANANCTANIIAANVIDLDETPTPMAGNYSFTFGTDAPPTVTSTVPANGATGVAGNANIVVNFSEAVTTTPGWATLVCGGSPITATTTGTGATRTLDPDTELAFNASCTVTVNAAGVSDVDLPADPMAADFVFGFTVVADLPPTVASTVPANNATNVGIGSNLTITFSEPVTLGGSWFAIECTVSGGHPAVVSGGSVSFTLDPIDNFDNSEVCTVSLNGALIVDQDGAPQNAADYSFSFTTQPSTANYYQGVDTSSAAALRTSLHNLIDDHRAFQYSITGNSCNLAAPTVALCDAWDIVEAAEQDPTESNKILDVYRNRKYTKITDRSGSTGPTTYNREHTWPNSLGFGDLGGGDTNGNPHSAYTDAHMLYASASDHNQDRGNKPYANCPGCPIQNPTDLNHGQGGPGFPNEGMAPDGNAGSYEVWDKRKGDVARAILYMDVRYAGGTHGTYMHQEPELIATDNRSQIQVTGNGVVGATGYMGLLSTLLEWHFADPPDAIELARHEVVFSFQQNRNPFVDHPEYAACIFQNQCGPGNDLFKNGFE